MTDVLFFIHLAAFVLAVVGIMLADKSAFAWIRGSVETLEPKVVMRPHWIVTVALTLLLSTGLYLFWPMREYLLEQPLFLLKMGFVLALLINALFIERLMQVAFTNSYRSLTAQQKLPLFISGAVSTLSWIGAVTTALILFGLENIFSRF